MSLRTIAKVLALTAAALAGAACSNDGGDAESDVSDVHESPLDAFKSPSGLGEVHRLNVTIVKDEKGAPRLDGAGHATLYATYFEANWDQPGAGFTVIARSSDSGASWAEVGRVATPDDGAWDGVHLDVAPTKPNVLYLTRSQRYSWGLGRSGEAVFLRSADGGKTWEPRVAGLPAPTAGDGVDGVDINPGDDGRPNPEDHLLAVNCAGVHKSLDGGKTWSAIQGSIPDSGSCNHASLVRGVNDRKTIYALYQVGEGGGATLVRSTDDGRTWKTAEMRGFVIGATSLVVHPLDAKRLYLVDMNGFHSSNDGGETFHPHNRGFSPKEESAFPSVTSAVAIDTVSAPPGSENARLYIQKDSVVYQWTPANEPEGGHWSRIGAVPDADFGDLHVIDSPRVPTLLAVSEKWYDDGISAGPRKLQYALIKR